MVHHGHEVLEAASIHLESLLVYEINIYYLSCSNAVHNRMVWTHSKS